MGTTPAGTENPWFSKDGLMIFVCGEPEWIPWEMAERLGIVGGQDVSREFLEANA